MVNVGVNMEHNKKTMTITYCLHWNVRVEVGLIEQDLCRLLRRHRLNRCSPSVTQDCRVEAISEVDVTKVRVGTNPVVIDRLIGSKLNSHSLSIKHKNAAQSCPPTTNE